MIDKTDPTSIASLLLFFNEAKIMFYIDILIYILIRALS
jgi:hypothetical protein